MKSFNLICIFLFLLNISYLKAVTSSETNSKEVAKYVEEGPYVETKEKGVKLSGYIDAGYQYNFINPSGADAMANNAAGAGFRSNTDSQPREEFGLSAVKLALEKPLTNINELQAGFRVDLMFGQDIASLSATSAAAANDQSDSFYVEQAYAQFRLPYENGIDFKVGKFVSLIGYEVIERPQNLNITYGNLFQQVPFCHMGILSSYKFNEIVDAKFGILEGWCNASPSDNNLGGTPNQVQDGAGLTGSFNITAPPNFLKANIQNNFYYGINNQDGIFASQDNGDLFLWDVWGNWTPSFAQDKLLLALNADFGVGTTAISGGSPNAHTHSNWWGAALYAKYQFTDIFSLAGRADYIHNDDSNKFGNDLNNGNEDIWSYTVTARFDVIENMVLRTEYRVDIGDDIKGYTHSSPAHQATVELIYSF